MPKLILFAVSESTSVDMGTNKYSLFNLLEQGIAQNFPANLPQVDVTTLWSRGEDEVGARMSQLVLVLDPLGREIGRVETSAFSFDKPRHRIVNRMMGAIFPMPGEYEFKLFVKRSDSPEYPRDPTWIFPYELVQGQISFR